MIKEVIGVGATEQLALEDAKKQLGLGETDDFESEVIQFAEKKKFGLFGGAPAKVRVIVRETVEETAQNFIRQILDKMQLEDIQIESKGSEGAIEFDLSGENVGFIIGRRGETLDAIQYLTNLAANHGNEERVKITVNTGNYREKREKTLEILGKKIAIKVAKTGRKESLEPMNPYERRIIHTSVQKVKGAISWSEGENAGRHVVIGPDPKVKVNRRSSGYNNRRGGGRRSSYNSRKDYSKPNPVNPDRVPLNEGGETGLYGRIDK